jgi:hypothetical protein
MKTRDEKENPPTDLRSPPPHLHLPVPSFIEVIVGSLAVGFPAVIQSIAVIRPIAIIRSVAIILVAKFRLGSVDLAGEDWRGGRCRVLDGGGVASIMIVSDDSDVRVLVFFILDGLGEMDSAASRAHAEDLGVHVDVRFSAIAGNEKERARNAMDVEASKNASTFVSVLWPRPTPGQVSRLGAQ